MARMGEIRAVLERRFGPLNYAETTGPGSARRLTAVAIASGAQLVVAIGGDGTLSECADAIALSERPETALAHLPAGTGSDFIRNLGSHADAVTWAERITWPDTIDIDCIAASIGERRAHVINVASFGISGEIAASVNARPRPKLVPGKALFFGHSVKGILGHRPSRIAYSVDGGAEVEAEITILAIANAPTFGGSMRICPGARIDDGIMDVTIVRALSRLQLLALFPLIYSGRHVDHPAVTTVRARSFSARPVGDRPVPLEIDGENAGHLPVSFSIRPRAIRLAMPVA